MQVYQYDDKGYYLGVLTLDDSDKSPSGRWNIPARCVEIEPPAEKDGYKRKWSGSGWEYEEIPKEPEPPEPPELTEEEKQALIQAQLTAAVQAWMDKTVQARNYDNIHTACTYANSTDEIFKAEGTACLAWRDDVWRTCYNILNEVLAGTREIPTEEELLNELPVLVW